MFGKVFICALLAAVSVTALIRFEDTVEFSPWCSCRVPVKLVLMLPRNGPCKQHKRFKSSRLYLTVLLLLLAGDVELNPGPFPAGAGDTEESASQMNQLDNKCDSCDLSLQCLTLRSGPIKTIATMCIIEDCSNFIHDCCKDKVTACMQSPWTCSKHSTTKEHVQIQLQPEETSIATEPNSEPDPKSPPPEDPPRRAAEPSAESDPKSPPPEDPPRQAAEPSTESLPGPSYIAVNLMDVMEAVRLTQMKVDRLSEDLVQVKQLLGTLQPQCSCGPASPRRREQASPRRREQASPRRREPASSRRREPAESGERSPTASGVLRQSRSSSGEQHGRYNDKTARQLIVEDRSQSLLVIGDSNVRRLQASNNCPGTTFHSLSDATTEHVAQDLGHAIDMCGAAQVVLHVGTNDIARKGSEGIAKSILGLAQQAKGHTGVRQVYICSVTPRKDLGSFVFSRSESVNNRLRSLCNKTDRVSFIDVRQKLDRCQFGGLVRDAIHYNRPGAAQALKLIKDSAKDFLV